MVPIRENTKKRPPGLPCLSCSGANRNPVCTSSWPGVASWSNRYSGFGLRGLGLPLPFLSAPDAVLPAADLEPAAFLGAGFLRLRRRRFLGAPLSASDFVPFFAWGSAGSPFAAFAGFSGRAFFFGGAKPKNSPG
jgi:hypothetical protein